MIRAFGRLGWYMNQYLGGFIHPSAWHRREREWRRAYAKFRREERA